MSHTGAVPRIINSYIAGFPPKTRTLLVAMRRAVRKAAPDAEETICYRMPTFRLNGNLVHFAGYTNHIGFYPTPSAIQAFRARLRRYQCSKGAVQFPLDRPIPAGLVAAMVAFRVKENLARKRDRG